MRCLLRRTLATLNVMRQALYKPHDVHHNIGVPHYTTDPLYLLEGMLCPIKKVERDYSCTKPMYVLTAARHDVVISDVTAWYIGD